ncbi:MAG: hypothetical protein ACI8VC_001383 [Candidatus Endobugula sp.]|jgi:hypothetical protein
MDERPSIVDDKVRIGHWEGDTVIDDEVIARYIRFMGGATICFPPCHRNIRRGIKRGILR